jgi:hypothetical protein
MSRKQIGSLVGAVLLAAIAPLLVLALLHGVGGTARAGAPPATYWKVSMPDLGQHSDRWCWVGAAANSMWWYAYHGQPGLLGGAPGGITPYPWEAIDAASLNSGSLCWFDSRDAPVQPPPAPPSDGALIPGYATVLKKIAESTFHDANQDGKKQLGENNYCYGEGVEKWDYLIGLRDYVNNYSNGLVVHDIINPLKCGTLTGWIVNRTNPTQNLLNPCGPGRVVPGGVPGVNQIAGGPAFMDYMTELSRGQDVLLWIERYEPETAHVVTGVGYNNAGGVFNKGTITISDPWTHATNPPVPGVASASHTDGLLPPWQSKADHNISPNHGVYPAATEPYNLCDVKQVSPLIIQCYDEDLPGTPQLWSVVDMIFVSPYVVGGIAELPDIAQGSANAASLPADSSSPSTLSYIALAGVAAAALFTLTVGAWYARRRWQR